MQPSEIHLRNELAKCEALTNDTAAQQRAKEIRQQLGLPCLEAASIADDEQPEKEKKQQRKK